MNTIGYDFLDTWVQLGTFQFAARLSTAGNLYAPDPARTRIEVTDTTASLRADGLIYGGGQGTCAGSVMLDLVLAEDGTVSLSGCASHGSERCRSITLLVRGMDIRRLIGESYNMPDHPLTNRRDADTLEWPGRQATMPLVMIDCGAEECFALARDDQVRKKAFSAYYDHLLSEPVLVLSHSADARKAELQLDLPTWEVGRGVARTGVVARRFEDLEAKFGMKPFEAHPERQWVKDLKLVVNLHGVHWTGHVFLRYNEMADALRKICATVPGEQVLAFLPAWEGRYYVNSPVCEPAPELGGPEGLRALVDTAHALGCHIIPMLDGPNLATDGYLRQNDLLDARLLDEWGDVLPQNWCDWDSDLNREKTGWIVNYGHPGYRQKMVDIACGLVEDYGFDGIFLDGAIRWENSPDYSPYEGMKAWGEAVQSRCPGALLMAEDGYDLLWDVFGLFATSMQPLGIERAMLRYTRQSWYLAYPAPGGSGGIHEQAWFSATANGRMKEWIIPTFAVVSDTMGARYVEAKAELEAAANWRLGD